MNKIKSTCTCGGSYRIIDSYPILHKGTNKAILYVTYECNKCKLYISKTND